MGGRAGGGAATCCGAANVGPRRAERRGRDGVRGPAGVPSGRRAGAGRRQPRESARGGGGGTADPRRAACAADALSAPRGRRPRRWRGRRNCAERSGRCEPGPRSAPLRTFAGAGYKMAVMPSRSGGGSALPLLLAVLLGSAAACPDGCVCDEERLRCGGLGLPEVPRELSPGLRHV